MTADEDNTVTLEEAKKQVEVACRRIALLHLSYAKTLVEEFGEEIGRKLILKAIKDYGIRVGERTKRGEQDLPKYGLHERIESVDVKGEKRIRVYGCVLAREWREWGEDSLGRLYRYIDPAKSMSVDPTKKLVHMKAVPDGDDYCELVFKPTTERERKDFADKEADWGYIDKISE
jgi:predicted hydrocarbon binding protein